jgi:transposase InsO family protein
MMCQVLKVSRTGYYDWLDRPASSTALRHEALGGQIKEAHQRSHGLYGSPRVHQELLAQGVKVSLNTVAKVMNKRGIRSKMHRKFKPRTTDSQHGMPVAKNLLARQFNPLSLNLSWCSDITYIFTDQGTLYLAVVLDLCSRRIVGWAMAEHQKSELAQDALKMALRQRCVEAGLLCHSDQGAQYAADDYQMLLAAHGLICSMSAVGECYDNAVMESFFGTLKTEEVFHKRYRTHSQARLELFEYMEVFYNRQRRHSSLGYMSPETFEASLTT